MITLEFRLLGKPRQYAALDEAIRTTQFIWNTCVRYWQDTRDVTPYNLNKSTVRSWRASTPSCAS